MFPGGRGFYKSAAHPRLCQSAAVPLKDTVSESALFLSEVTGLKRWPTDLPASASLTPETINVIDACCCGNSIAGVEQTTPIHTEWSLITE